MQILFIISLAFAILVSIFAVMNSDPVTIKLLWKQFEFSQAIVILGSAAFGAIIVAFLGTFSKVKSSLKIRELQNKIKNLEKKIEELKPEENLDKKIQLNDNINGDDIKNIDNTVTMEEENTKKQDKQQI